MHTFKEGFTLAEVLITLLIIGVIASIVIPGIINNTNEAEYNAGIKKVYADLSNAVKVIQVNNGGTVNVGDVSGSSSVTFRDDFCNVMSCIKTDTATNIFGSNTYKYYKGVNWNVVGSSINSAAALNNGTLIKFESGGNCNNFVPLNVCGYMWVDINGQKGPNMWGKDLYFFYVARKNGYYSLLPAGTQNDTSYSATTCAVGDNGVGCTAWRLRDPDHMP